MPPPLALICDHRGEGWSERAAALGSLGFVVTVASTLRQSIERLASDRPCIIVLDPLASAGTTELELLDRARQSDTRTALLVVADDDEPILRALAASRPSERGPWDVIRRGAPLDELLLRADLLQHQVEAQREMDRLRHLATHDDRTDLLRPQVFQDQLRAHFSASQRHHLNLALLLIDLDEFGQINKLHNHTIGDTVITQVGATIRGALRAEDVAARLGGDEFCVLLPYTRKVDAARVVQRLLDQIRELSGELPGATGRIEVGASIGFETFNGSDLDSVERLRLHAEEALRQSKRGGGNRGVYYRQLDAPLLGGSAHE